MVICCYITNLAQLGESVLYRVSYHDRRQTCKSLTFHVLSRIKPLEKGNGVLSKNSRGTKESVLSRGRAVIEMQLGQSTMGCKMRQSLTVIPKILRSLSRFRERDTAVCYLDLQGRYLDP